MRSPPPPSRRLVLPAPCLARLLAGRQTTLCLPAGDDARASPAGAVGDRRWLAERTFLHLGARRPTAPYLLEYHGGGSRYLAPAQVGARHVTGRWVPATAMPRWAARLAVVVTGARRERLHAADEAAMRREGARAEDAAVVFLRDGATGESRLVPELCDTVRGAYRSAWDAEHGPALFWATDPVVWRVEVTVEAIPPRAR